MALIDWDNLFYVDPATGETVPSGTPGALPVPTYANYGGGGFSAGEFGGQLIANSSGQPYSYAELTNIGTDKQDPLDLLDYLFYQHDVASSQAGQGYTQAQALADATLLTSLLVLDASYDPEASFYAGLAELGMAGRLAIHGELDLLSPWVLYAALNDAASDIQFALQSLPPQELALALTTFFEPSDDPSVFTFDFDVSTTSVGQEFVELVALNAANYALDSGEADDAPISTGFPSPGTSAYELAFNVLTSDLDLLSI